jgi:hypothetical protein
MLGGGCGHERVLEALVALLVQREVGAGEVGCRERERINRDVVDRGGAAREGGVGVARRAGVGQLDG